MVFRSLVTGLVFTVGAFAQLTSFPKPSYFRETFQKSNTKVELRDPIKLKDFVVDGKLELSLKNYLALAMENNTDIQLQLLTVEIPKNNILGAYGAWDPLLRASFNTTRATTTNNNPTSALDSGIPVGAATKSLTQPYSASWTQTLPVGVQYSVGYNGVKTSSSPITAQTYNPSLLTSNLQFNFSQPLLRNRGAYVNKIPLMQAQVGYKMSQYQESQQLLNLVSIAETAYWNVINAAANVTVAESGRKNADEFLKYMQKQLDLGAISPLDIYNPQQSLAATELTLSQAKFNLAQAEDALRHQMGADLDPDVRGLPVVLTESVDLGPAESVTVDREQAISKALVNHPAIRQALQRLDFDDLGIQSARNGLLPNLALTGTYTSYGRGGNFIDTAPSRVNPIVPITVIPGGLADALTQMFGFGSPTYVAGLTLNLPVRSKTASATMANAVIQKKTDALNLRNTQQGIRLNILNAVTRLEGAKEQLKLAQIQRDFAQKNLDAENTKFQLGTEINQNVINAQQVLVQAESAVVTNQIGVRLNLLNLLTQTGDLLDERGIVVK
jgi:outer membrane protein TolC